MEKKQVQRWKPIWDKYKFVVLVAAAGIALLLWPSSAEKTDQASSTAATTVEADETSLQDTEERMEAILSHIHGVGQLELMLTLDKSAASQYVQDTELTYSGETQAPDEYQRSSETVILSQGSGQEGLVLEESVYPIYRGALVVCEGGGNAEVRLAVTAAVAALTGLSSDRITVAIWQE